MCCPQGLQRKKTTVQYRIILISISSILLFTTYIGECFSCRLSGPLLGPGRRPPPPASFQARTETSRERRCRNYIWFFWGKAQLERKHWSRQNSLEGVFIGSIISVPLLWVAQDRTVCQGTIVKRQKQLAYIFLKLGFYSFARTYVAVLFLKPARVLKSERSVRARG